MKKIFLLLASAAIVLAIVSCEKIRGKGDITTEDRSVTGYTGISLALSGTVYFNQDSNYSLRISAQQNVLDRIITEVDGNTLIVKLKPHVILGQHDPIRIYISAPYVSNLEVSGSGDIYAENKLIGGDISVNISGSGSITISYLEADHLSAKISGSGSIKTLGGKTGEEDLKISGSGDIDQQNVVSDIVYTSTSGSGETYVNAQKLLDVNISGSGDVFYYGNPMINVHISGSGSLKKL